MKPPSSPRGRFPKASLALERAEEEEEEEAAHHDVRLDETRRAVALSAPLQPSRFSFTPHFFFFYRWQKVKTLLC